MAQQQSWSEWFFGSSKPETTTPTTTAPVIESGDATDIKNSTQQAAVGATGVQHSSSPYGPFVRTGRGGAGNYTWQAGPSQHDVEANEPQTLTEQAQAAAQLELDGTEIALRVQQARGAPASQYVRLGRGYVERKDIQNASSPTSSDDRSDTRLSNLPSATPRSVYRGRGGAGNYAAAALQEEQTRAARQEQQRNNAESIRDNVAKHVDETISSPQEALLGRPK